MTSANFQTIDIDSITVPRESRQRRELSKLPELAESIRTVGLINPPVITSDYILVAGERRLEACKSLGWTSIPVQFAEDLDPITLHLIELEENVKRLDLTWKEHNDAIATYHKLKVSQDPEWNFAKSAESLGITRQAVGQHIAVKVERNQAPDDFEQAEKFSSALNIAQRKMERRKAQKVREVVSSPTLFDEGKKKDEGEETPSTPAEPQRPIDIQCQSFLDWAPDRYYNFIHCDFPYGVNVGDKKGQGNAQSRGQYEDKPETYFALLDHLVNTQDKFIYPSSHMLFWFSMKFYYETREILEGAGWRVDPFPFIWHKSDNSGIIPDTNRGPRRTYETALFCTLGDRRIVKPVANSYSGPTTKVYHTSEKPRAMLEHFFRMLVDETTILLDPTCGSGMAVKVAEDLGAEYALGLELSEEYAVAARQNCSL